jgi:RNA polymerase sigma-70 factor, ECF subfamily
MDRDLVERASSGDQAAFATLATHLGDTLFGVARRILGDRHLAEDVLQEALVVIWRKLPSLREPERFEAWAFRILVRTCYAAVPINRRWAATVRVLPLEQAGDVDEIAALADRDELERAFRGLPFDQRAVIVLHHHLGLPLTEVGDVLGVPAGTARSRLHYAMRSLRAAFEAGRVAPELEGRRLA